MYDMLDYFGYSIALCTLRFNHIVLSNFTYFEFIPPSVDRSGVGRPRAARGRAHCGCSASVTKHEVGVLGNDCGLLTITE